MKRAEGAAAVRMIAIEGLELRGLATSGIGLERPKAYRKPLDVPV